MSNRGNVLGINTQYTYMRMSCYISHLRLSSWGVQVIKK